MKVSMVIPTLNEEKNIGKVLREIPNSVNEIIIVDGHSIDKTVNIAKKYNTKIIYDDMGKGSALIKGMKTAKGDIVITMDADCSHISNEISLFIERIITGFDICMGSRFIQGGGTDDMSILRKVGNRFFVLLVNLLWQTNYSDICYGYMSFKKSCINKLNLKSDGFGIEAEIAIKAAKKKLKVIEIPSYERKRRHGKGKLFTVYDGIKIFTLILKELFVR